MSKTSKSPKKIIMTALRIAKPVLPDYWHKFSPQKFTLPQLLACLVLKIALRTDYRGIVALLQDCPDLCRAIGLKTVPHFTTLHKASRRLLRYKIFDKLLGSTVRTVLNDKPIELAAIDSTGMEAGHVSRYFVRRKRSKQLETWEETSYKRFPKLAVVGDCKTHLILSAITTRGPTVDVNQFCKILKTSRKQMQDKMPTCRCRLRQ